MTAGLMLLCAVLPVSLWGQSSWPSYPNNTAISVTSGGNVGIGTSPAGRLTIRQSYDSQTGGAAGLRIENTNGTAITQLLTGSDGGTYLFNGTAYNYLMMSSTGNVGIGTTSPSHRLQVAGDIDATEVIVSSTGADYVFDPGYRLAPLPEVAAYIQENHHLPNLPSATEVQQNGVGMSQMQTKLLAKIEELTLHMIQAEERNNRLERELGTLRQEYQQIRESMARAK